MTWPCIERPATAAWRRLALSALSVAALASGTGCKTPNSQASSQIKAELAETPPGTPFELSGFDYTLDRRGYFAIARRVGCDRAKKILALPQNGNLAAATRKLARSTQFYNDMRDTLSNNVNLQRGCTQAKAPAAEPAEHEPTSGVEAVVQAAGGAGVTIVLVGGFGQAQSAEGILAESRRLWEQKDLGGKLSVGRADCPELAGTLEECADFLVSAMKETPEGKKLLFWAHGSGGNIVLEALSKTPELRDRTLGIVTVGAPIGGAAIATILRPTLRVAATAIAKLTGTDESLIEADPVAAIMLPVEAAVGESRVTKIAEAKAKALEQATRALHPNARGEYIRTQLLNRDFSRSDHSKIPVFHVAAALDFANLNPLPVLTVKDGKIVSDLDSANWGQLLAFIAVPTFANYPLSDGIVALEHAVIPKEAVPSGLDPKLIALFTLNHTTLTFSAVNQKGAMIPNVEIVDGLLDTVATNLAGGI
jgi:hypothetical protein